MHRRSLTNLVLVTFLLFSVFPVQAATISRPAFVPGDEFWASNFGPNGAGNSISDVAVDGEKIFISGNFLSVGGIPAAHLAMWDGDQWSDLNVGAFSGVINDLLVDPNGSLYVTGTFTTIGGVIARNIALWDGVNWLPLGSGLASTGYTLEMFGDDLLVGGAFASAGGDPSIEYLALWDGTTWLPAPGDYSDVHMQVQDIAYWQGNLVVGGIGGVYLYDGMFWSQLGNVTSTTSMATDGTYLYVGGSFTSIGGVPALRAARWDGLSWSALGDGLNGDVLSMYYDGDRGLIAVGAFTSSGVTSVDRIARWDGVSWLPLEGAFSQGTNNTINEVTHFGGGQLLFVGSFTLAGGVHCNRLALYDAEQWRGIGGDGMVMNNEYVRAFASDGQGNLYVGVSVGSMTGSGVTVGNVAADYIARWDGSAWHALAGGGVDGMVLALAYDPIHEVLYAGGQFTQAGGVAASRIARWDGVEWQPLGSGMNGDVTALAVDSSGNLVAGGNFSIAGEVTVRNLARWKLSPGGGGIWENFLMDNMDATTVQALLVDEYDRVLVGGALTGSMDARYENLLQCWGIGCRGLASTDTNEQPGTFNKIIGLAFDNSGNLYVADDQHVEKLTLDENGIAGWQRFPGAFHDPNNHGIKAIAVDRTGQLYAAGWFEDTGQVNAKSIARWNGDEWQPLGSGLQRQITNGGAGNVYTLAVVNDSLYVGGQFDIAGGKPSYNIARYALADAPVNQPPVLKNWQKDSLSDQTLWIGSGPFVRNARDPERDFLVSIRLLTLPDHGQLLVNDTPVTVGQIIPITSLPTVKFIPQAGWVGQTTFTYTASDAFTESTTAAQATLTFQIANPCNLPGGVIGADRTLTPTECDPYIVQDNLIINQGTKLTLEPGTRLYFDGYFSIIVNGLLESLGSEQQPVLMTSNQAEPAPGDWGGLVFSSSSGDAVFDASGVYQSGSILRHTIVEYAGSNPSTGTLEGSNAVILQNASPLIEYSTVRFSAGNGLYGIAYQDADYLRLWGNTFSWNTRHGVYLKGTYVELEYQNFENAGRYELLANRVLSNGLYGIAVSGDWARIVDNISAYNGLEGIAAILVNDRSVTTDSALIHSNSIRQNGRGGIYAVGMAFEISNNMISENRGADAGGIYVMSCILNWCKFYPQITLSNNTISSNTKWKINPILGAGGIYVRGGGRIEILGNLVLENQMQNTRLPGGGVVIEMGVTRVQNNRIGTNTSEIGGGGFYQDRGSFEILGNEFLQNTAAGDGGAVLWGPAAVPTLIEGNTFHGNQAARGNAIFNSRSSTTPQVPAANNYWGTVDLPQIENDIYHFNDDTGLGFVNYSPVLTGPIELSPSLEANYDQVRPGDRVNFTARMLQPLSAYTVQVNGVAVGEVTATSDGHAFFTLTTSLQAGEGQYMVALDPVANSGFTASAQSVASLTLLLSQTAQLNVQAPGDGPVLDLPASVEPDISYEIMLPVILGPVQQ